MQYFETARAPGGACHREGSDIMRHRSVLTAFSVALFAVMVALAPPAAALHENCGGVTPTIEGTTGDDVIRGTADRDVIFSDAGNDTIEAAMATMPFWVGRATT